MVEKLVERIVKQLVTQSDSVMVSSVESAGKCVIQIQVAQEDIARVIGNEGRTLRAIRTLAGVGGAREQKDVSIEIVR